MRSVVVLGPRGLRLRCLVPFTHRERARGLLGREPLGRDEALLLTGATSVHTFGMRAAILVARLDDALSVVDVRLLRPRRVLGPDRRARHVLECRADVDVRVADVLRLAQAGQPPSPAAPVTVHEPARSSRARFTPSGSSEASSDA